MKKRNRRLTLAFDRLLSQSLAKQLLILVGMIAILFAISHIALSLSGDDWKHYCDANYISHWVFPLYLLIDANAYNGFYTDPEHPMTKLTLFICGATFVSGVLLFTGALISILTNVISQRVERHSDGLIHYLKSGHYIIMGYDDMAPSIINNIFTKDHNAYILLMSAVNANTIREKLRKTFTDKQIDHIIINYGLRTSKEFYSDIHLECAEEIFIVGNRALPAHDAMNVECIDSICSYLKEDVRSEHKPKRITCIFEDLDTYAAFKTTEIFKHVGDLDIEFVPYNFYTGWANQVLLLRQYKEKSHCFTYPAVFGNGIKSDDEKFVHLVFVGITNLSAAFAMEAAHMLHFPNFDETTKRPKTRITFIDTVVDKEMPEFITRNRHFFEVQSYLYKDLSSPQQNEEGQEYVTANLSDQFESHDFLDVEFEFIKGDIFSQPVQDEISGWATGDRYLSIFLTMSDQRKNFIMAMNMPDVVYDEDIPVFIRQNRSDNFVTNLRMAENTHFEEKKTKRYSYSGQTIIGTDYRGRYANIYPFGMNDMAFSIDETSLKRAKLINYLYNHADYTNNRFMNLTSLAAITPDELWKQANKEWKELTVALQWSNLYCSYNIITKLASLRVMRHLDPDDTSHDQDELTTEELNILAKVEHNRWNVEKLLMGYRKACVCDDYYAYKMKHKGEEGYDKDAASQLKSNRKIYIHHDIRPYDELEDNTKQLDIEIVKYIPWILKTTEA